MKNSIFFVIGFVLFSSFTSLAQKAVPDSLTNSELPLISINVSNGADFLRDPGYPAMYVKDSADIPLLYSSSLWMGGLDETGSLHVAAMTYRQRGHDFYPGPISADSNTTSTHYNRIYTISKSDIDQHIANPGSNNAVNEWPGNGNTQLGEPHQIAPFVDLNTNKIYEPSKGEYPLIRGNKAHFSIFNDKGKHDETSSTPLEVDVRVMIYTFDQNPALENKVFVHYNIENRSSNDYNNAYFGVFNDFEVGHFSDDMIGTDSLNQMVFSYNDDDFDSEFGQSPPAIGMKWLSDKMDVGKLYENSNNPINGNPRMAADFYSYLRGVYKDSTSVIDAKGNATKFEYYGDITKANEWHEFGTLGRGSDKRVVSSIGPIDFKKGEVRCFDIVYLFEHGSNHLDAVKEMQKTAKELQAKYDLGEIENGFSFCRNQLSSVVELNRIKVSSYPNPARHHVYVDLPSTSTKIKSMQLIDALGRITVLPPSRDIHLRIPTAQLSNGVYQIVIVTDRAQYVSRFIKQ